MLVIILFYFLAIDPLYQLKIKNILLNSEWIDYKLKYKLEFSGDEDIQRKKIFLKSYKFIVDTNAKNLNFTLEMNKFGHLTKSERPRFLISENALKSYQDVRPLFLEEIIPLKYDYRKYGVVSHVKDEYRCRSSYAFSAVGAIESAFAISTGILPDLSEQEIVSCSKKFGNNGCYGGEPENVFEYCMKKGLSTTKISMPPK
ncbi:hypothetical protein MXB_292 [Myxobolus squamalis]|nr:hypothetical protein MXB_292 [Myxobolus squamalis]